MRAWVLIMSGASFSIALGLQLVCNDIPGAFVGLPAAVMAALFAHARPLEKPGLGALPVGLATAGYFAGQLIDDGTLFTGYGFIADVFAIGLGVLALALYPLSRSIVRVCWPSRGRSGNLLP